MEELISVNNEIIACESNAAKILQKLIKVAYWISSNITLAILNFSLLLHL